MKRRASALFLLALLAAGCHASRFERIDAVSMAPRMAYRGFSFERPPMRWYLNQSEQSHTHALLRRDLFVAKETHTAFVEIAVRPLDAQPASHEEFAALAKPGPQQGPYPIEEQSRSVQPVTRQGQWCIRHESNDLVRGAPVAPDRELAMRQRGFRCLHPAFPKMTLDFLYSERGLPEEIDEDVLAEGERILASVRIDVAPDTPAGIAP